MNDRLEIASRILAGLVVVPSSFELPSHVNAALAAADALIATNEATAKPVLPDDNGKPLWKRLVELGEQVPDAEWANVPPDLARRLDRYLYGGEQALPAPLPDGLTVTSHSITGASSGSGGHWAIADSFDAEGRSEVSAPRRRLKAAADADLPAVRAAATAYSAAKGCRAVFVEEGCSDA